jgi:hypothetical protein
LLEAKIMSDCPCERASFPKCVRPFWRMVKMRFGTDELGTDEIGTDGLINLRLVKPSCAS